MAENPHSYWRSAFWRCITLIPSEQWPNASIQSVTGNQLHSATDNGMDDLIQKVHLNASRPRNERPPEDELSGGSFCTILKRTDRVNGKTTSVSNRVYVDFWLRRTRHPRYAGNIRGIFIP
jgi:hypothetical protein